MDFPCRVESGVQVLARLINAPKIKSLHPNLLPDGPEPGQVIELSYDSNVPQNLLTCELVLNTILPTYCGGKNTDAIILITDGHFNISSLINMLRISLMSHRTFSSESNLDENVQKCLKKLQIMTVYDSHQFFITIQSLENLLSANSNISLILIDTMSAFYWSDRMLGTCMLKMDLYLKNILRLVQIVTKEYKTVILYTKPSYFVSKGINVDVDVITDEPALEKINHKIVLKKCSENNDYQVTVSNCKGVFEKKIIILENKLKWL